HHDGKPCWIGDICLVLQRLPTPIHAIEAELCDNNAIQSIMKRVEQILDTQLQSKIDMFTQTHLLRDRVERIDEGEGESCVGLVTRHCQHYLDVPIPSHCKAI
ncbi:hypothetical protein B0H17DRAFT_904324, partial [Mycena rosella]